MCAKEVKVSQVSFGADHKAAICCALIGSTEAELVEEAKVILQKKPDVIEWRADFFEQLTNAQAVLHTLEQLHKQVNGTVLLFTIRSEQEGGESISLSESEQEHLLKQVLKSGLVQMIDFEVASSFAQNDELKQLCKVHQVKWIGSTHDFKQTPSHQDMLAFLQKGESLGADLVKLAVMPHSKQDVLSLFTMTHEASENLSVPVITMAMGTLGVSSRLIGDQFGSVMTFAVGHQASAPGQVPLEIIRDLQAYTN